MRVSPPIVFIHVPKTAGTTFVSILARNLPNGKVHVPNAFTRAAEIDERLRSDRARRAGLLHGHVPLSLRSQFPPESRFVTFLREPNARLYSHYRHQYNNLIDRGEAPPLAAPGIPDNLQARMLCALPDPFTRPADDELLEAALRELRGLAFYGVLERFAESMLLAQRRLGLRWVAYRRENIRRSAAISPGDADTLQAQNELDLVLYETAVRELAPDLGPLAGKARSLERAGEALTARRPSADLRVAVHVAGYGIATAEASVRRRTARWRRWRSVRAIRASFAAVGVRRR
jgi:hypothetical protein